MDITLTKTDELNAVINVKIQQEDYSENVEKVLRDYRKKATIPGFRAGKVPMGHIKKLYGKAILAEEINKVLSKSLTDYLFKEELHVLGEPLPNEESDKQDIDWDTQKEFDFAFDIGLSPEFEIKLSKREKLPEYSVKADDKLIEDTIKNYTLRHGENQKVDVVELGEETLRGDFVQLGEDGNTKEDGISKENGLISLQVMKDEELKKQFNGKKVGDTIDFDLKKAYPNDTEVSSLLGISKEEAEQVSGDFRYTINEINKFVASEINQELFDKIYGEGVVTSTEDFREKIIEEIKDSFKYQSDYKFLLDAKEKMLKKLDFELPDEFLKRWLLAVNKELTADKIAEDYDKFKDDMRWQLIIDKIAKENEMKIEEDEILTFAKESTLQQFRQYGMSYIPEEQLEGYAKEIVSKPEERRKIVERLTEDKALNFIKESVKIDEKEVTLEEFNNFFK